MSPFKKLAAAAALALCAILPAEVMAAQKALFLTTAEWNAWSRFSNGNGLTIEQADARNSRATDDKGKYICLKNAGNPNASGNEVVGCKNDGTDYFQYTDRLAWHFITNTRDKLQEALGSSNVIVRTGALSTQWFLQNGGFHISSSDERVKWDLNDFNRLYPGDIVVVQSTYQVIDPQKAAAIVSKIEEQKGYDPNDATCGLGKASYPPDCKGLGLTFILLLDTCVDCSWDAEHTTTGNKQTGGKYSESTANLNSIMQQAINDANGWNLQNMHLRNSTNATNAKDPHTRSAYASSISDLSQLQGHTTGAIQCVPQQNILFPSALPKSGTGYNYSDNRYHHDSGYYCNSSADKDNKNCVYNRPGPGEWPELNASSSFGMMIPFWQNNKGQGGACIYLGQDSNIFDDSRSGQLPNIISMFKNLPAGACKVARSDAQNSGVCKGISTAECVLIDATGNEDDKDLAVLAIHYKDENGNDKVLCPAKIWGECTDEARADAYCINEEKSGTHCCTDCTDAIRQANGLCKPGQQTDINCCQACPTDPAKLPVCASGQTSVDACCKDPDPTCTAEQLTEYCCDAARSECCKPCDETKKQEICKDDENPELRCCTCPPVNERPICKAGQRPYGSTKSGAKAGTADAIVCCREVPSTGAPVPVNNPWALGLLGAAVAAAAAATRRRRRRK